MPGYRKPTTTNPNDFWFVQQSDWDRWLKEQDSDEKRARTAATSRLKRYDAVGRIMETSEGMPASAPCYYCKRRGYPELCRIYRDRLDRACAFCKKMNYHGCVAGRDTGSSGPGDDYDVAAMVAHIEALEATVASLERKGEESARRIEASERMIAWLLEEVRKMGRVETTRFRADGAAIY